MSDGHSRMGIEFQHVFKRFGNGALALDDVSVAIPEGSLTFLTGHSGAGKTTFLNLLLRADKPTRGTILVNDVDVTRLAAPGTCRRTAAIWARCSRTVNCSGSAPCSRTSPCRCTSRA